MLPCSVDARLLKFELLALQDLRKVFSMDA